MSSFDRLLLFVFGAVLLAAALFIEFKPDALATIIDARRNAPQTPVAVIVGKPAATSTLIAPTIATPPKATTTPKKIQKKSSTAGVKPAPPMPAAEADPNAVNRIINPYSTPPESFEKLNEKVRAALVNIVCSPHVGVLRPVSGSGVIIDPRGVILTNAHVAQYVLLSQSADIDLSCVVRSGSPATAKWRATTLYIPAVWVHQHAHEITAEQAVGTGEHDYALLLLTGTIDGTEPSSYPFVPFDTREAIGFQDDPVLVASYPVEFIGSAVQSSLYAVTSVTSIKKLLTFVQQTIDLISLGGIIGAQSGSSGGAVVNEWGRLVGLVVTTSPGATTGERDLHALTTSYISRDLAAQSQLDLPALLSTNVRDAANSFSSILAPELIAAYLKVLGR